MPELHKCLHRNLGRAKGKLRALWIQHPGGNGESGLVGKLAYRAFAAAFFPALVNMQRLTKEGMPAIVDGDLLKKMGIM